VFDMLRLKNAHTGADFDFDNADGNLTTVEQLRDLLRNKRVKWYRIAGTYGSHFVGIDYRHIDEYLYMQFELAQDAHFEEYQNSEIYDPDSAVYQEFSDSFWTDKIVTVDPVSWDQIKRLFKSNNWEELYK